MTLAGHSLHKSHTCTVKNSLHIIRDEIIYTSSLILNCGESMSGLTKSEINKVLDDHIGSVDEKKLWHDFKFSILSFKWLDSWTQSSYEAWEKSGRSESF